MLNRLRALPTTQHARALLAARIAPKPLATHVHQPIALHAPAPRQDPEPVLVRWTASGIDQTMVATMHGTFRHHDDLRAALSARFAVHPDCIRIL
jgi:hypothetical protein